MVVAKEVTVEADRVRITIMALVTVTETKPATTVTREAIIVIRGVTIVTKDKALEVMGTIQEAPGTVIIVLEVRTQVVITGTIAHNREAEEEEEEVEVQVVVDIIHQIINILLSYI